MEKNTKTGLLRPDILFRSIYEITPDFLLEQGIRGVIFDIDNTIAPYEIEEPTERMKTYLNSLRDRDIQIAFVTNNHDKRVSRFNRELGFPYYSKAKKPFPGGVKAALKGFGLPAEQVLAVGDQLFTDCLSAHLSHIRFYIVPPIRDRKTAFFRMKRTLEKPFLKSLKSYPEYLNAERED